MDEDADIDDVTTRFFFVLMTQSSVAPAHLLKKKKEMVDSANIFT